MKPLARTLAGFALTIVFAYVLGSVVQTILNGGDVISAVVQETWRVLFTGGLVALGLFLLFSAAEINADVRARTGGDFTAKDFRTLHGTVTAAVSLARSVPGATPTARKRAISLAIRLAADALGNTPAVARSSYVDPRVIDAYERGDTLDSTRLSSAESQLRDLLGG